MGKLPIPLTLGVIIATITISIVWSLIAHPGSSTDGDEADGNRIPQATGVGTKTGGRP